MSLRYARNLQPDKSQYARRWVDLGSSHMYSKMLQHGSSVESCLSGKHWQLACLTIGFLDSSCTQLPRPTCGCHVWESVSTGTMSSSCSQIFLQSLHAMCVQCCVSTATMWSTPRVAQQATKFDLDPAPLSKVCMPCDCNAVCLPRNDVVQFQGGLTDYLIKVVPSFIKFGVNSPSSSREDNETTLYTSPEHIIPLTR